MAPGTSNRHPEEQAEYAAADSGWLAITMTAAAVIAYGIRLQRDRSRAQAWLDTSLRASYDEDDIERSSPRMSLPPFVDDPIVGRKMIVAS